MQGGNIFNGPYFSGFDRDIQHDPSISAVHSGPADPDRARNRGGLCPRFSSRAAESRIVHGSVHRALLFNDGKLTPREELWKLRSHILLLALGLVFATVLIAGPFIHWLIPTIPLSAAFALAAILSPTDAVAVGSLSGRVKLPGKIMHLLEGEALMNDASGLVAFNFAIAATVTGYFSLTNAIGSFWLSRSEESSSVHCWVFL